MRLDEAFRNSAGTARLFNGIAHPPTLALQQQFADIARMARPAIFDSPQWRQLLENASGLSALANTQKSIVDAVMPSIDLTQTQAFAEMAAKITESFQPTFQQAQVFEDLAKTIASSQIDLVQIDIPQIDVKRLIPDALGALIADTSAIAQSLSTLVDTSFVNLEVADLAQRLVDSLDVEAFEDWVAETEATDDPEVVQALDRIVLWAWNMLGLDGRTPERLLLCAFVWLVVMAKCSEIIIENTDGVDTVATLLGVSALSAANTAAVVTGKTYDRFTEEHDA